MIHWIDEFMRLFGYKRSEVWEAERKERNVSFPAPQAFPDDMKPPPGYRFKEPRKRSNVRSKRANVRSKRAGNRSQSAERKALQEMHKRVDSVHAKIANVRSKKSTK